MTRGYIKDDIRYLIIILSRVMGLPVIKHLNVFMVNFIETIKMARMPLDWAATLSENLCEQLEVVKDKKKFYMTSYWVNLLVARMINYPKLYKRSSM